MHKREGHTATSPEALLLSHLVDVASECTGGPVAVAREDVGYQVICGVSDTLNTKTTSEKLMYEILLPREPQLPTTAIRQRMQKNPSHVHVGPLQPESQIHMLLPGLWEAQRQQIVCLCRRLQSAVGNLQQAYDVSEHGFKESL